MGYRDLTGLQILDVFPMEPGQLPTEFPASPNFDVPRNILMEPG